MRPLSETMITFTIPSSETKTFTFKSVKDAYDFILDHQLHIEMGEIEYNTLTDEQKKKYDVIKHMPLSDFTNV